jgi:hypothetical protein
MTAMQDAAPAPARLAERPGSLAAAFAGTGRQSGAASERAIVHLVGAGRRASARRLG